uniref:hypothetical protein n=1 Tax=Pseudomonas sp. TaxID=306 RepID=UPI003F8D67F6
MVAVFRADPAYAAALLSSVEADGDPDELAIVRRQLQLASMITEGLQQGAEAEKAKL